MCIGRKIDGEVLGEIIDCGVKMAESYRTMALLMAVR
jgi:hypothetical protein